MPETDKKTHKLSWTCHTSNLLHEIVDNGLAPGMGVLRFPINQFRRMLIQVAEVAIKIDDPELNMLMCRLTLFDCADPGSENYNPEWREIIQEQIDKKAK